MKYRLLLSYVLSVIQLLLIVIALYFVSMMAFEGKFILRAMKYHYWIEVALSLFLLYSLFHFARTSKASSKMRKAAGVQKEVKSKRIQVLIFFLMLSLIFYSLFYTVPMIKYIPFTLQGIVYYLNSMLEFLLLIALVGSHEDASVDFVKSKQKYAGVGAAFGLTLFYIYFQLIN